MTAEILLGSVTIAQAMLVAAMGCNAYRLIRGPRAQDRVLCLDAMYVCAMLLVLTIGIRTGSQFLMRGEVIE
jgi:multicomponent K+:H+ antiporter subunit F